MSKSITMIVILSSMLLSCKSNNDKVAEDDFQWQIDQFDDMRVMRYQVPEWNTLTLQQKEFIYYLCEAAYWGRDILTDQFFKYNLLIRRTLEGIYTSFDGDKSSVDWKNFEKYLKKVWFANGIHHHYSNDKFTPDFSEDYFRFLLENSENVLTSKDNFINLVCNIIFNENLYKSKNNTEQGVDIIAESADNFYENLNEKEVIHYYDSQQVADTLRPISKGLNSKLFKDLKTGKIYDYTYRLGGMYNDAIVKIIENLELAVPLAETSQQQEELRKLINFYKTGDLSLWDEYNILWAQNTDPRVDYVNGFIETYGDPLGFKATWEAVVNFKDTDATKKTEIISANAQWFEDHSPVDQRFRKPKVKGITAKAINVVALAGDCFPTPPIGINLPNADWIRKDYGSKSVTITNLIYAYDQAALQSGGTLQEFAANEDEILRARKYGTITSNLHTDLHECLGHGSGQLLPDTDPNALKNHASTLEEARADLFALYYIADDKIVELGLLPDKNAFKAEYDSYIRNGLLTQLTRIQAGKKIEEAHMRDRALIARWAFAHGLKDNVISMFQLEGKTYVKINNYKKLRSLFGELLAEIQRIKSEGDYRAGAELVESYGVDVDPALHNEILARYKTLNLAPYGGFVNPQLTRVFDDKGALIDITVSYTNSFVEQMLFLSKNYSALTINN